MSGFVPWLASHLLSLVLTTLSSIYYVITFGGWGRCHPGWIRIRLWLNWTEHGGAKGSKNLKSKHFKSEAIVRRSITNGGSRSEVAMEKLRVWKCLRQRAPERKGAITNAISGNTNANTQIHKHNYKKTNAKKNIEHWPTFHERYTGKDASTVNTGIGLLLLMLTYHWYWWKTMNKNQNSAYHKGMGWDQPTDILLDFKVSGM